MPMDTFRYFPAMFDNNSGMSWAIKCHQPCWVSLPSIARSRSVSARMPQPVLRPGCCTKSGLMGGWRNGSSAKVKILLTGPLLKPKPRNYRNSSLTFSTFPVYIYIIYIIYTSSTAQGGGGSFKNRKPIGELGCCESGMAERSHWWIERCLRSPLFLSLFLWLSTYLPAYLLCIYLSIDLSISLFLSFI